jgi:hypothetical protein
MAKWKEHCLSMAKISSKMTRAVAASQPDPSDKAWSELSEGERVIQVGAPRWYTCGVGVSPAFLHFTSIRLADGGRRRARVVCPGQPGGMHRYGVRIMMYEVHVCSLKDETSHELRHY